MGRRIILTATEGFVSASMQLTPRSQGEAVGMFADYVGDDGLEDPILGYALHHPTLNPAVIRAELGGHDLACSCKTDCHADVLLLLANSEEDESPGHPSTARGSGHTPS